MLSTVEAAQGPGRQEKATAGDRKALKDDFSSCKNTVKPREGSWRLPGGEDGVEMRDGNI